MPTSTSQAALQSNARAALSRATIRFGHVENDVYCFDVVLGNETVQTTFNGTDRSFGCTCSEYDASTGTCIHVEILKFWRAQQNGRNSSNGSSTNGRSATSASVNGKSMPPPPVVKENLNGKAPSPASNGIPNANGNQSSNDSNGSAPQPPSDNGATPTSSAPENALEVREMAARTLMPWGKFKGSSLAQLAATPEGQSYLFFIARKSEPKNDGDRDLVKAADAVMMAVVELAVAQAAANPDQFTPVLPFGEDKGKPLHKAHPKWAAILSKKSDEDARSFQDLVLYRVAKSLHAKRGGGFSRAGGGLTPQQFEQLLTELRGIRSALEGLGKRD